VNVQTEVVNRNREMFFSLHVALVTMVCSLQVWYIHLKTGDEKLEERAGKNCKYIMKDLKSSVLSLSKEDIKKWLGYVVFQKENTKFSFLIEKEIIPEEGKKIIIKKIFL